MTAKILVTIGPNSLKQEIVKQCATAGVYVFRVNLSHTPLEKVADYVEKIQSWTDVPVCLDSEGAQLRNEKIAEGWAVFEVDTRVNIYFSSVVGNSTNISFSPSGAAEQFEVGDRIRIDFNGAQLEVVEIADDHCVAIVNKGGRIGSNKAADIERPLKLDAITKKDQAAIEIGKKLGVRHFALSFANAPEDVARMRDLCGDGSVIISKIETHRALSHLKEIFRETDEILIDRGDLSRELPLEKIPFLQRRIVSMAKAHGVPVYIATNLLESMVEAHAPTRAEVNDVVSSLLMGADGLVLAAETAIGRFPVDCVHMVRRLADLEMKWTEHSSIDDVLAF